MIDEKAWVTWREFNQLTENKTIIFFGYSHDWIGKTLAKSNISVLCILDNSDNFIGQNDIYSGNTIFKPQEYYESRESTPNQVKDLFVEEFIVITSLSYESIYYELIDKGYKPGIHFCITPALNSVKIVSDINSYNKRILVSSPDHSIYSRRNTDFGGGLYVYDTGINQYTKIFSGTYRQICRIDDDRIGVLDETEGIKIFSFNMDNFITTIKVPKETRPHGFTYDKDSKLFYVAFTAEDKFGVYNEEGVILDTIIDNIFNYKYRRDGRNHYWINDLAIKENYLYASMFSISGCQKEQVYDGGIVQINTANSVDIRTVVRDLWMPHTVRFFNNQLHYLDSMNGKFYRGSELLGEFNGFTRGLAYDGAYYLVGQSENRYYDYFHGKRLNVGMNAGFYLFDPETKAAKFFSMPELHQVHDLLVLE